MLFFRAPADYLGMIVPAELPRTLRVSDDELTAALAALKERQAQVIGVRFLPDRAVTILIERRAQPR